MSADREKRVTLALAVVTALVLVASVPGSLRGVWERGGFYIFSGEFLLDLPKRLFGPGRFRFLVQPAVAIVRPGTKVTRAPRAAACSPGIDARPRPTSGPGSRTSSSAERLASGRTRPLSPLPGGGSLPVGVQNRGP